MNWDAISFDWNQVRAFLATAEEGTFSAAARALKTTQPTIGRQISELEDRLGVTLLERSVKGPKLTEAGTILLHHVRAMSDAAAMISMAAVGQSGDISGSVRITASDFIAVPLLPKLLAPLRDKAPNLRLEILASNTIDDLLRRDADIALRHVRPEQPELFARHVADLTSHFYASKAYLDRHGRPKTARDMADHSFVGTTQPDPLIATFRGLGLPVTQDNFVAASDHGVVVANYVRAGFGVSLMPTILGAEVPGLERVLIDIPTPQFPLWLVSHRELQTSQRIRIVFDHLALTLADAARTPA
ncbi:DNA-binding transcriptional LysR family regulator [Rubricella aquisinus]|uniref:DNA-binding transcriptional LysR family regulator n=1 Tax=Rubricella aquisinus TaxID=2028108 RepID=A0A840WN21_9RHOB|nr:LysR family transcriptional regulator [Rubricella aquisinus]MBB5516468.1 DNA-binding transcriptional LysR family regulator [Rubricella aquisinus]